MPRVYNKSKSLISSGSSIPAETPQLSPTTAAQEDQVAEEISTSAGSDEDEEIEIIPTSLKNNVDDYDTGDYNITDAPEPLNGHQALLELYREDAALESEILKEISQDYEQFAGIDYLIPKMDKPALSMMSYDERTRDRDFQKIQAQLRLCQRIIENGYVFFINDFKNVNNNQADLRYDKLCNMFEDALVCHRDTMSSLDRVRATVVARKIKPDAELETHRKMTLFEKINGPDGFTQYVEQASKEKRLLSDIRGSSRRRQRFRSNPQATPPITQGVSKPPEDTREQPPRNVSRHETRFSYRGRGRGRPPFQRRL